MLNLTLDLDTGLAKLAAATTIKAGAQVPVTITTMRGATPTSPGAAPAFELGLGTDATPPVLKAYLATFAAENAHTFTGTLDANDTRLVAFMAGKGTVNFGCEIAWTVAGELQAAPSFTVPVQPRIIPSNPTSEGGPDYYTEAEVDALLAAGVPGTDSIARASIGAEVTARTTALAAKATTASLNALAATTAQVRPVSGVLSKIIAAVAAQPATQTNDLTTPIGAGATYADHSTFTVTVMNAGMPTVTTFEMNQDRAGTSGSNFSMFSDTGLDLASVASVLGNSIGNRYNGQLLATWDGATSLFTCAAVSYAAAQSFSITDANGWLAMSATGSVAVPEHGPRAVRLLAAEPGKKHALLPGTLTFAYSGANDWTAGIAAKAGYAPFTASGAGSVGTVVGAPFSIPGGGGATHDLATVVSPPDATLSAPPENTDLVLFQTGDETASNSTITFTAFAITFPA